MAAPATIPPTNPPPGWLCPAKSRYSEPTITITNTTRIETSSVTMRDTGRAGGTARSVVPDAGDAGDVGVAGRRPARARATVPMATAANTVISPSVS